MEKSASHSCSAEVLGFSSSTETTCVHSCRRAQEPSPVSRAAHYCSHVLWEPSLVTHTALFPVSVLALTLWLQAGTNVLSLQSRAQLKALSQQWWSAGGEAWGDRLATALETSWYEYAVYA